jgi:LysR family cys regulon transcriptional activator
VIQQYVTMDLGVGIVASMAAEHLPANLHPIPANHLFAPNVTRVAVRRGAFLREYAIDFIQQLAPKLKLNELAEAVNWRR